MSFAVIFLLRVGKMNLMEVVSLLTTWCLLGAKLAEIPQLPMLWMYKVRPAWIGVLIAVKLSAFCIGRFQAKQQKKCLVLEANEAAVLSNSVSARSAALGSPVSAQTKGPKLSIELESMTAPTLTRHSTGIISRLVRISHSRNAEQARALRAAVASSGGRHSRSASKEGQS